MEVLFYANLLNIVQTPVPLIMAEYVFLTLQDINNAMGLPLKTDLFVMPMVLLLLVENIQINLTKIYMMKLLVVAESVQAVRLNAMPLAVTRNI